MLFIGGGVNGEEPLAIVSGELEIYFTYELMPKATKQKDLMAKAYGVIKPLIENDDRFKNWRELLMNAVKADRSLMDITWLQKHLNDYTAKNSFDYFIHKDLGGFLRRELDFFIKNEVLVIDDLTSAKMKSTLAIVKAIEQVGNKIITFLAQLEDFQKKLWLKKKFVVGCDYCITLDRIPESMYSEIIANDEQRKEWVRLFAIDEIKGDLTTEAYSEPLTIEFLKQNPFLVLDTKFFSLEFKHKLLATMENIDGQCNGLLVNSENFQALNLLKNRFYKGIDGIYIDPPYNTAASEIAYKNNYKRSSWTSLMNDRLFLGKEFLKSEGISCTTIDDFQLHELSYLLRKIYGEDMFKGTVAIKNNPSGRSTASGFSIAHEYGLFYASSPNVQIGRLERTEEQNARYDEKDEKGAFEWVNFRKHGGYKEDAPTMYFPIYITSSSIRIPKMSWHDDTKEYEILEKPNEKEEVLYPIDENGRPRRWKWGLERTLSSLNEMMVKKDRTGHNGVYIKSRLNDEGTLPLTVWDKTEYSSTAYGYNLLKDMFGNNPPFEYPKSLYAVEDSLRVLKIKDIVLDYFAGSATSGHAVIDLNRQDKGNRKYILVDMAYYFITATMPRIEKAIYSSRWKNGKPTNREGVSQCFKYIRLEQYEDTLNNLVPKQSMPAGDDDFQESYMLGYMLDTDTRGSLLNLKMFKHPFDVKIKTTKDNELVETPVDMVETFNYLIGLNVETESWHHDGDICVVEGKTHIGNENALVIWRDCEKIDNDALNEFFRKQDFNTLDMEYDVIYVNGDNTLPNVRRDEDHWKVVLTEDEFKARMFEED